MSATVQPAYYAEVFREDGDQMVSFGPGRTAEEVLQAASPYLGRPSREALAAEGSTDVAIQADAEDDLLDYIVVGRTIAGAWDFTYRGPVVNAPLTAGSSRG